jgi:hypothetical protein
MATVRKPSGSLKVTGTLDGGRTFNSAGGGYAVILKSDDEQAINLLSRARKHASAEITFEFFDIEEVVDPEDPDQLKLDGLQDED